MFPLFRCARSPVTFVTSAPFALGLEFPAKRSPMKSVDKLLREAFERERIREEADPSIPVRRAAMLKRLEEIERLRAEKAAAKKLPAPEEEHAKAAKARLLYFQGPRFAPAPQRGSKSGKLADPRTCPHLLTSHGHCEQCGEGLVPNSVSFERYRRKHS